MLTSDPRIVQYTQTVDELTFEEASELAYFGAQVCWWCWVCFGGIMQCIQTVNELAFEASELAYIGARLC